MDYQIIVDSCVDFNDQLLGKMDGIVRIPFKIIIDGKELIDEDLDTSSLLAKMKAGMGKISTACPSPYDFYDAFKRCPVNFAVTISSKLSGSYQSAMLAKKMLEEEGKTNAVYVIDSKTASAGQSLIVLKLKINQYIAGLKTLFLPVSIDNLEKNGRISSLKARIGKVLHVIPILGANEEGEIVLKGRAMSEKQAVEKFLGILERSAVAPEDSVLAITFVDTKEKAEKMREVIQSRLHFKETYLFQAGGLSTVYADSGGLVFAF